MKKMEYRAQENHWDFKNSTFYRICKDWMPLTLWWTRAACARMARVSPRKSHDGQRAGYVSKWNSTTWVRAARSLANSIVGHIEHLNCFLSATTWTSCNCASFAAILATSASNGPTASSSSSLDWEFCGGQKSVRNLNMTPRQMQLRNEL